MTLFLSKGNFSCGSPDERDADFVRRSERIIEAAVE